MNVNRGSVCKGGHEPQARLAKTTYTCIGRLPRRRSSYLGNLVQLSRQARRSLHTSTLPTLFRFKTLPPLLYGWQLLFFPTHSFSSTLRALYLRLSDLRRSIVRFTFHQNNRVLTRTNLQSTVLRDEFGDGCLQLVLLWW